MSALLLFDVAPAGRSSSAIVLIALVLIAFALVTFVAIASVGIFLIVRRRRLESLSSPHSEGGTRMANRSSP